MLLRLALGTTAITEGLLHFARVASLESFALGVVLVVAGSFVSIGLFTTHFSVVLAVAVAIRHLLELPRPLGFAERGSLPGVVLIAVATAVALLGPGLFSMDFRLFGHREIVIPRRGQD